ncbi:hypothetical protein B7Y94_04725 [Candidatus Saccharibacteria bacterium 32-49-12]|nr:MAG: hypothetical protein B7Y94_04725 [Candidatus Saccharibacteria bacterium 32-49-12]
MNLDYTELSRKTLRKELLKALGHKLHPNNYRAIALSAVSVVLLILAAVSASQNNLNYDLSGLTPSPVLFVMIFLFLVLPALLGAARRLDYNQRLQRFARANNMSIDNSIVGSPGGMIFQYGNIRGYKFRLKSADGLYEWGSYYYGLNAGFTKISKEHGYIAKQIPDALPDMIIESKVNSLGVLTRVAPSLTRLDLGQEFANHFNIYVRQGNSSLAASALTVEFLQLMLDCGLGYSWEVSHNTLYLYTVGFEVQYWKPIKQAHESMGAVSNRLLAAIKSGQSFASLNTEISASSRLLQIPPKPKNRSLHDLKIAVIITAVLTSTTIAAVLLFAE